MLCGVVLVVDIFLCRCGHDDMPNNVIDSIMILLLPVSRPSLYLVRNICCRQYDKQAEQYKLLSGSLA